MPMGMEELQGTDIITAGFPCQDLSYAGKGAGLSGKRSGLWWQVRRTVRMVRPQYVLLENVAALLTRGMGAILGSMAKVGYDSEWHCIPAASVGSPQLRDRVWILCHTHHYGQAASEKPEGIIEGENSNTERTREALKSARPDSELRQLESIKAANDRLQRGQGFFPKKIQRQSTFSWCEDIRSLEDLRSRQDLPTPLLCGANDGIRDRIHRTQALGNTIVPDIPELVADVLMELKYGKNQKQKD